jgi:hypothetical protein
MSQIGNITLAQVAQKGNELNFYSQFRTKTPYNQCNKSRTINVGTSWSGNGSMPSVVSGIRSVPSLPCISNSTKRILSSNISTSPAANGEQFLGFGYIQASTDGYIIV